MDETDHGTSVSRGIELEGRHHHDPHPTFLDDLEKLEADLDSPNLIYFENNHFGQEYPNNYSCCSILWWKWKQSRIKMWCGTGCGRLCLILFLVKLFILAVLLPVVHLQESNAYDHHDHAFPNHEDGYPTPDNNGNYPSSGNENGNGNGPDYSESVHVQPPLERDQNGNGDHVESGNGVENGSDDIIVVRHEDALTGEPSTAPPSSGDDTAPKISNESSESTPNDCPRTGDSNPLESKLESIISSITNIHQSIEKMETLMQTTLMDDQRGKTISAIHSGNTSLALKHWGHILKYLKSSPDSQTDALTLLIKEAYNGVPEVILPLGDFLQGTGICGGFSTLYNEMINYGHVFGGHPYIFPLALKLHQTPSCSFSDLEGQSHPGLPSAVTSILEGSFTLQNKGTRGYLYYAKRCVARHYYHCLDVLTKRVTNAEFSALEEGSEEWRRYRWRSNATSTTSDGAKASAFFFVLNEDKYLPYRLQDLNNSPRFKMEEASSQFEVDMGHFQFGLENEEEVVIQVRDTDMFLEGEEGKEKDNPNEVLLHSFHKTDKTPGTDRIRWIVRKGQGNPGESGESKMRIGRDAEGKLLPFWIRKSPTGN